MVHSFGSQKSCIWLPFKKHNIRVHLDRWENKMKHFKNCEIRISIIAPMFIAMKPIIASLETLMFECFDFILRKSYLESSHLGLYWYNLFSNNMVCIWTFYKRCSTTHFWRNTWKYDCIMKRDSNIKWVNKWQLHFTHNNKDNNNKKNMYIFRVLETLHYTNVHTFNMNLQYNMINFCFLQYIIGRYRYLWLVEN